MDLPAIPSPASGLTGIGLDPRSIPGPDLPGDGGGRDGRSEDVAEISPEGRAMAEREGAGEELSPDEEREVRELERRDREVRAHEQAHAAAGGAYVRGGPSFEFETGPDGRRYAVEGHVGIDVSPEKDPRATIRKMEQVKRAATAPANPSSADRRVVAKAAAEEARARRMLMEESRPESAPPTGAAGVVNA